MDTPKPDGVPDPPRHLKAAGRAAWDRYWRYGKVWLAETDVSTITELCEIHDEVTRLRRLLDKEGWTQQTGTLPFLEAKATRNLLMQVFEGDDVKVNLVLYQLRQIALDVGDIKSRPHPAYQMLLQVRSRLLPLWIDAHMTPSSRGRANVKVPTTDPLDAWEKGMAK
ncbi:MAG TPA: hypothetical protein VI341_13880 [Actinomycetota bacterium]